MLEGDKSRGNKTDGRGQETHRSGQRGGESNNIDGLQDEKKGQGAGQRRITGQQAGQGHIARYKGTGSSMEIHRQRVRGRMEDREDERKGTGRGAQMEKETLQRERGRKRQDRGREVEKGRKK